MGNGYLAEQDFAWQHCLSLLNTRRNPNIPLPNTLFPAYPTLVRGEKTIKFYRKQMSDPDKT